MIIEYQMRYSPRVVDRAERWVTMCGIFRDWDHFNTLKSIESGYGREVQKEQSITIAYGAQS